MFNDFNDNIVLAEAGTSYSDIYQIDPNANVVDASITVSALDGTSPTLDVTAQVSLDGKAWKDRASFEQFTEAATKSTRFGEPLSYVRFKLVTGGTTPTGSLSITAQMRTVADSKDAEFSVTQVGKVSGGDFTVAYNDATSLTLGGFLDGSAITADDITSVVQINAAGSTVKVFDREDAKFSIDGTTLTILGAEFASTDVFIVYTNEPNPTASAFQIKTAGADSVANPMLASIFSFLMGFNGSDWDRIRTGLTAVASSFLGILNTIPWGIYHTTPTTRTDGQGGPFETDASGNLKHTLATLLSGEDQTNAALAMVRKPLAVSTYTPSKDVSSALEASTISKATPGNLFRAFGVVDKTAATGKYYIQFLDSATLPADGAVTHIITPIAVNHTNLTDTPFDTGMIEAGVAAGSGIVMVISTTLVTKTIGGAYMFGTVLYK